MLRITLPTARDSGAIVLEGRLTGLWSQVLLLLARQEIHGHRNAFDLRDVLYVDSVGEQALQTLGHTYGAIFIAESPYAKYLCKRLKLRRVSIAEVENMSGQAREGSPTPKSSEAAYTKKENPLTCIAEKQHLSRCGE